MLKQPYVIKMSYTDKDICRNASRELININISNDIFIKDNKHFIMFITDEIPYAKDVSNKMKHKSDTTEYLHDMWEGVYKSV